MESWKDISFWMDQVDQPNINRTQLAQDIYADVVIIGAGFTGLWTAYYLKRSQPDLNVVVLEAEVAGYGASGRNGGWLMGQILGQDQWLAGCTPELIFKAHQLIQEIPDEVDRVTKRESINCDLKKGGVYYVAARYKEQHDRLKKYYNELSQKNYSSYDYQWLNDNDLSKRLAIDSAYSAIFSPHCATIQPAKLVRGLADTVERMGVQIFEHSKVISWEKGSVKTAKGRVYSNWVVPALEAYGGTLSASHKNLSQYHLPVQSLIIATEPLSESLWEEVGLKHGEAFADNSRNVTYGIRTADNRMVFGARGSYRFGGNVRKNFSLTKKEIEDRKNTLVDLFPQLSNASVTHGWGGNLAVSREFMPHIIRNSHSKYVIAGGYGGEGVGATNLAGRTLASLILGEDNELVSMPWVTKEGSLNGVKKWESEPLPWLGYKSVTKAFEIEDKVLSNANSSSWQRKVVTKVADAFEKIVQ